MLTLLCCSAACSRSAQPATATQTPSADAAWLRPVPAGEMAAIYFTVHNPTEAAIVLTGVTVDGIARSTFHESMEHAGMSHMSDHDSLVVPAHDSIVFAPRALHVMAAGVPKALVIGDAVGVVLSRRGGAEIRTRAIVRE